MKKAYILAYVIRTELKGVTTDTDYYEVFCEETPLKLAKRRVMELGDVFCKDYSYLYSWNIARIVITSEHYLSTKL